MESCIVPIAMKAAKVKCCVMLRVLVRQGRYQGHPVRSDPSPAVWAYVLQLGADEPGSESKAGIA